MQTLHRYLDGPGNSAAWILVFIIAFAFFLGALWFTIGLAKRSDREVAEARQYECDEECRDPFPLKAATAPTQAGEREFSEPDTDAVIEAAKPDAYSDLPPAWISPESIADPALEALGAQSAVWLPPPPVKPRLNGHAVHVDPPCAA
jgi:hypothetical protein